MPDIRTPRTHINLDTLQRVETTNEEGKIIRPTWEAESGAARAKEIAEARMEAEAEHQRYLLEVQLKNHPHSKLISDLQQKVAKLEGSVKYLTDILNAKIAEEVKDAQK